MKFPPLARTLMGPMAILAGTSMLLVQIVAYLENGWLSARLIGGGIGLVGVGAFVARDCLEDWRATAPPKPVEPEISAEEFDNRFRDVDESD